jgi:hypothetical protein
MLIVVRALSLRNIKFSPKKKEAREKAELTNSLVESSLLLLYLEFKPHSI